MSAQQTTPRRTSTELLEDYKLLQVGIAEKEAIIAELLPRSRRFEDNKAELKEVRTELWIMRFELEQPLLGAIDEALEHEHEAARELKRLFSKLSPAEQRRRMHLTIEAVTKRWCENGGEPSG